MAIQQQQNESDLYFACILQVNVTTLPYARFDVGKTVNHAHNDWAEWAVDGGIPFL
jgi:hypothetical protein